MAFADQDLTQRNFQALSEGLKDIRSKYADVMDELLAIREENGKLRQDISVLRGQNGALLARFHGTGSTSA